MPNSETPPDPNAELLAQLAATSAPEGTQSNEDILAALNVEPEPDPLAGVEYTGDLPTDAHRELSALEQGFKDRAKREAERFQLATDSEYWFCVCFKTRADKDRFLAAARLVPIGDKYLDGYAVARALNIEFEKGE